MIEHIAHAHAVACQLTNGGLGEQPDCADYFQKAKGLLTDPAHVTGELIFDAIENSVWFVGAWFLGRFFLRREHRRLDVEHGVTHTDPV